MTDWTVFETYEAARREDHARSVVKAAGKDWKTHLMKFSGAVVPR